MAAESFRVKYSSDVAFAESRSAGGGLKNGCAQAVARPSIASISTDNAEFTDSATNTDSLADVADRFQFSLAAIPDRSPAEAELMIFSLQHNVSHDFGGHQFRSTERRSSEAIYECAENICSVGRIHDVCFLSDLRFILTFRPIVENPGESAASRSSLLRDVLLVDIASRKTIQVLPEDDDGMRIVAEKQILKPKHRRDHAKRLRKLQREHRRGAKQSSASSSVPAALLGRRAVVLFKKNFTKVYVVGPSGQLQFATTRTFPRRIRSVAFTRSRGAFVLLSPSPNELIQFSDSCLTRQKRVFRLSSPSPRLSSFALRGDKCLLLNGIRGELNVAVDLDFHRLFRLPLDSPSGLLYDYRDVVIGANGRMALLRGAELLRVFSLVTLEEKCEVLFQETVHCASFIEEDSSEPRVLLGLDKGRVAVVELAGERGRDPEQRVVAETGAGRPVVGLWRPPTTTSGELFCWDGEAVFSLQGVS